MEKVTDRMLWSVLLLAIGVSLFVFFKPAASKIVHGSFDNIQNIKNKDDSPLTDVKYYAPSGVISSPKSGVYDINTYAVPLSQDRFRQSTNGDGVGFGFAPLKHAKDYLYDFSYDIVLKKGQIVTLGGHNRYHDADSKLLVNGQKVSLLFSSGQVTARVNAPNGLVVGQKYHVDEIFRVNNTNYGDTAVYIQPNRTESDKHDFQAEVSNVKFDKYVVK